jgi:aminocarboxymuconate-semialdehyde decarboxylase
MAASSAADQERSVSIDIHSHIIPPNLVTALAEGSYEIEVEIENERVHASLADGSEIGALRSDLRDIDGRLEAMDAAGIDVQVLAPWIDLNGYVLAPAGGARYSRLYNESLAGVVADHPDRFLALANVPLQASREAAAELRYAVQELDMAGAQIATTVAGGELDDPELDPFWEAAESMRAILVLHPYDPLPQRGLRRYFLSNAVGRPAETTIAIGHMIFGGVFERFPELVVCVVHGGGFLPYQIGRMDRAFHAKPELAAKHLTRPPSEWERHLYYDTVTHNGGVTRFLIDQVGADHIVMGTDYPFEMGDPSPVDTVASIPGLTNDERGLILEENVRRLLMAIQA